MDSQILKRQQLDETEITIVIALEIETAARLGDKRKLFCLLHKPIIIWGKVNRDTMICLLTLLRIILIRWKKFFEARLNHETPFVVPDITNLLAGPYVCCKQIMSKMYCVVWKKEIISDAWSKAILLQIPKKDDKRTYCDNWREISLLYISTKIFASLPITYGDRAGRALIKLGLDGDAVVLTEFPR